jgi:hypothetical protein
MRPLRVPLHAAQSSQHGLRAAQRGLDLPEGARS